MASDLNATDFDPEKEFEFIERLGKGQFGEVWKVHHKQTNRVLAVKKVVVTQDGHMADLAREINVMKKCASPFIVRYYGNYLKGKVMWIVMEYCAYGSVNDVMNMTSKTLTEEQISSVTQHVLQGLAYMEENRKIHRDIKPHNILLNTKGEAKLADFGISRDMENAELRKTVIGTPYYLAPEVIKESGYDCRADIWALGISCIEMAEKDPPYADVHPMRVLFLVANNPAPKLTHPELWSSEFNDFVSKCLEVDPNKRPRARQLLSHPFVKHANPSHLGSLIQTAQSFMDKHGGLERALALLKPAKEESDDEVAADDMNKDLQMGSDTTGSASFSMSERQTNYLAESSDEEDDIFGDAGSETEESEAEKNKTDDEFDIDEFMAELETDSKPAPKPVAPASPEKKLESTTSQKKLEKVASRTKLPRSLSLEKTSDDVVWDTLRGGLVADRERVNPKGKLVESEDTPAVVESAVDWDAIAVDTATDPKTVEAPAVVTPRKEIHVPEIDWSIAMKEFDVSPAHKRPVSMSPSQSQNLGLNIPQRPRSTSQTHFDDLLAELDSIESPSQKKSGPFRNVAALAFNKRFPKSEVCSVRSSWVGVVSGENPFRNNPQFVVSLPEPSQTLITVKPDVEGSRIRFVILQVRDAHYRLPTLPTYGVHTEVPFSNDPEVSIPTLLEDSNFKYVIIPIIESLAPGRSVSFELSIRAAAMATAKALPSMSEIVHQGSWTAENSGGCVNHASWRRNPQYLIRVSTPSDIHLFITQLSSPLHFIGFYLVKTDDPTQKLMKISQSRILNSDTKFRKKSEIYSGRVSMNAGTYALVVATFEPNCVGKFNVALLSDKPTVTLSPLEDSKAATIEGSWTSSSAGGCLNSPSWIKNPKYLLTVKKSCEATIVLTRTKDPSKNAAVDAPFIGFYVFKGDSQSASHVTKVDVVAKTKHFVDANEVIEAVSLPAGSYIILPCTFHPNVIASFLLSVFGSGEMTLSPVVTQAIGTRDSWTVTNAGGSFQHSSWRANPQYQVIFQTDGSASFSLGQERLGNGTFPLIGLVAVKRPAAFNGQKLMNLAVSDVLENTKFTDNSVVSSKTFPFKRGDSAIVIPMTFLPFVENQFELNVAGARCSIQRLPEAWKWKYSGSEWSKAKNTAGGCMNNKATWQMNPKFKFGFRTKSKVHIFLSQVLAPTLPGQPKRPPTPAGFYVFKYTTSAFTKQDFVGKSEFNPTREISAEFTFEPGVYILLPAKFDANDEGSFSVHLFSEQDVAIAPM